MQKRRIKYNNIRCEIDGCKFDSKHEGRRYLKLKSMLDRGEITDLELQPNFKFPCGNKYIADFRYRNTSGEVVVEDAKSPATAANAVYRVKRKMMKCHHPDLDFREV